MEIEKLSYLSSSKRQHGRIKQHPEDFIVEEIQTDGMVLEVDSGIEKQGTGGKFAHFVLQKTNWSSDKAVKTIAKKLRISIKRFNYAGTKDKNAITTQLCSAFAVEPEKLLNIRIKDIRINGAWTGDDKVRMGQLLGNRFTLKIGDTKLDEDEVKDRYKELDGVFPNYYGEQRFGSARKNTHIVGQHLLKGDFESAALDFLADYHGEMNQKAVEARKELSGNRDFSAALKYFPKHLYLERSMLVHLSKIPNDYANAFRKLPRSILLLFIHAFQAYLFNLLLSERIGEGIIQPEDGEHTCGLDEYGFPAINGKEESGKFIVGRIIGYESDLNEREKQLVEELNMDKEMFRMPRMPEIGSPGGYRILLEPYRDFGFNDSIFRFSLQSGSYATTALREFVNYNF